MRIKKKITALVLVTLMFAVSPAFASFPVAKHNSVKTENKEVNSKVSNLEQTISNDLKVIGKTDLKNQIKKSKSGSRDGFDLIITLLLWFFLGWPFAAHRWYKRKPVGWNILFILTFAGFGIWAIVDLINILIGNF